MMTITRAVATHRKGNEETCAHGVPVGGVCDSWEHNQTPREAFSAETNPLWAGRDLGLRELHRQLYDSLPPMPPERQRHNVPRSECDLCASMADHEHIDDEPDAVDEKYAPPETNPAPPKKFKHVGHRVVRTVAATACGIPMMDLRHDEDYSVWVKSLDHPRVDHPKCMDCLKAVIRDLSDQLTVEKMKQGVEAPLGGLADRSAPEKSEPLSFLDEDLLCGDE